jgi:Sensors of blue-light using FAD
VTYPLESILYVSAATQLLSAAQMQQLLDSARARNVQQEVTGVLLYSDGNFMQYLEGPSVGLSKIYKVISNSSQHHGMIELLREPQLVREFLGCPMAFRAVGMPEMPTVEPENANVLRRLAEFQNPNSAARRLITKFWNHDKGPNHYALG